jgi:hypothetical protein
MSLHPSIRESAKPFLLHPFPHKENIFVPEENLTSVTAVIDWQFCSRESAFHCADMSPDLVQVRQHLLEAGDLIQTARRWKEFGFEV